MANTDHSSDEPWNENPARRLRDGGMLEEVKVLLREGHNCVVDTT